MTALCVDNPRTIQRIVRKAHPRIAITFDRRYTNRRLQDMLEAAIRNGLTNMPQQVVLIRQEDSQRVKELQAADFIA